MARGSGVEYHPTIRELPAEDRPRERLRDRGAGDLSNAELLAIILRTGMASENVLALANRLLATCGGLPGLMRISFAELCAKRGVGEAKAAQIKAALELGSRLRATEPEARPVVRCPQDAANLVLGEMSYLEQEHLRVVLLNTKNQVMGVQEVYKGNVNSSMVRLSEVFREAIRQNCPAMVVAHNHPSGDTTPSPEDVALTREMVQAGKLLGIDLLDHLIIGEQKWTSLKEKGLGFER